MKTCIIIPKAGRPIKIKPEGLIKITNTFVEYKIQNCPSYEFPIRITMFKEIKFIEH